MENSTSYTAATPDALANVIRKADESENHQRNSHQKKGPKHWLHVGSGNFNDLKLVLRHLFFWCDSPNATLPPRNKALLRDDKQPLSLNKAFFGPYVLGGGPIGGPLRFPWKFGWMAPHLIFQNLNQTKYRAWGRPLNTTLRQDKWHLLNNNLWISWVGSQRKNKSTLTKPQKKKTERC